MIDHNFHRIEKDSYLDKIRSALKRICSGSADTCKLGHCSYFGKCYNNDAFNKHKKLKLKSIYNNLLSHENKIKGRSSPHFLGNSPHEIAETILSQKVHEHSLVVKNPKVIRKIKEATTLGQICGILDMLHLQQHGRSKFVTGKKFKR